MTVVIASRRLARIVALGLGVGVTAATACGSDEDRPAAPADAAALPAVEAPAPPPPIADPAFPEGTRSLRLIRSIAVRLTPGDDGKRIGTVAQDTRVAWSATETAKGCKKPWVEIEP